MAAYLYYVYLIEANLIGYCLQVSNLSHAVLANANLSNANLTNANLRRSNLHSANLIRCHLESAYLSWSRLHNTNLLYADLSHSNLAYANLTWAKNINICKLDGILILNTTLPDGNVEIGHKYSNLTRHVKILSAQCYRIKRKASGVNILRGFAEGWINRNWLNPC